MLCSGPPLTLPLQVALVVALYLGSTGEKGTQVRTQVSGVACVCGGVKKETLKQLQDEGNMLKTSVSDPSSGYSVVLLPRLVLSPACVLRSVACPLSS